MRAAGFPSPLGVRSADRAIPVGTQDEEPVLVRFRVGPDKGDVRVTMTSGGNYRIDRPTAGG